MEPLLKIRNLSIGFKTESGGILPIVDSIDLEIASGEVLGIVGESGCGKTISALAILRLLPVPQSQIISGSIHFNGQDLLTLPAKDLYAIRGNQISMIFQEPFSAMNPLYTINQQLLECFQYHPVKNPEERILDFMKKVGIADPGRVIQAYPHQLSGGMLQRVMIAMALLLEPKLIIADEPTTALDVTVQAQIMDLLKGLQRELGVSLLLITHNLGLIAQYADRIGVMYAGRMVEEGPVEAFLEEPLHPYSKALLNSLPRLGQYHQILTPIPGTVPSPQHFVSGCRFHDRCSLVSSPCATKPSLIELRPLRKVACVNLPLLHPDRRIHCETIAIP